MAGILGDDDNLLGSTSYGSEPNYSSQLGRISGKLLTANLLRNGVDIAVDTNLLYLAVGNRKISINTSPPVYDLDVNSDIKTKILSVTNIAYLDNIKISSNIISTTVGKIDVYIAGTDIFHDRLTTSNLLFNDNTISSFNDSNITFAPNGIGRIVFNSDTELSGNLAVSGNISMDGDLTGLGTLTLGDQTIDTVTVNTDFTQDLLPGTDLTYALGADASDSSPRRWSQIHSPEWRNINNGPWEGSGIRPLSATISNQMTLDGVNNKISAIQSNEDILLNPDTGIVYIESTKWQDSDITNLLNTPITIASTGIGYYKFTGTSAMVVPSGTTAEQRSSPVVGETRWNTEDLYLECFDGTVWNVATGGGVEVTEDIMYDLGNVYSLILG
jgi:hypothetical protein